ncbi:uncharacterized protein F58A4.6 [Formica exsecta]|uniref:uncharacterized protein F58A4.6 n=1 Tax=Formica exsecta TaxID=72781 RepID=UPI001142AE3A|nr:uncharacterized protein F58A4.6 [Formica exsecta]
MMKGPSTITLQNIIELHKLRREMDVRLRLIIYRDNMIFNDIIVRLQAVFKYDIGERFKGPAGDNIENTYKNVAKPVCLCAKGLNSYLVSAYIVTLSKSFVYRKSAMKVLKTFLRTCNNLAFDEGYLQIIFIRLRMPKKQFLDYKWNEKLMQMVLEKQETDCAMSWLSTLGGAFSALGEEFKHCAEIAGKISVRQFELALRLDNPLLVARCRLYSALSLIQRGCFTTPKYMIQRIYKFALREKDVRLQNMCLGIWAKLRHNYKQYKQKESVSLKTLHISSKI